jgi:hypothetical protein
VSSSLPLFSYLLFSRLPPSLLFSSLVFLPLLSYLLSSSSLSSLLFSSLLSSSSLSSLIFSRLPLSLLSISSLSSHLVFVLASQVPFEPLLHRPARWAGTEWAAVCKPIIVIGRAKRGALCTVALFPLPSCFPSCFPLGVGGQFWDRPKLRACLAGVNYSPSKDSCSPSKEIFHRVIIIHRVMFTE